MERLPDEKSLRAFWDSPESQSMKDLRQINLLQLLRGYRRRNKKL